MTQYCVGALVLCHYDNVKQPAVKFKGTSKYPGLLISVSMYSRWVLVGGVFAGAEYLDKRRVNAESHFASEHAF